MSYLPTIYKEFNQQFPEVAKDELQHTVLMALTTVGFPTMIAAMKWVEEILEKSE